MEQKLIGPRIGHSHESDMSSKVDLDGMFVPINHCQCISVTFELEKADSFMRDDLESMPLCWMVDATKMEDSKIPF